MLSTTGISGLAARFRLPRKRAARSTFVHNGSDVDRLQHYAVSCSWPDLYYAKTAAVSSLLRPSRIVEIGVAYGFHARSLLQANPNAAYIGVDPYSPGYDPQDPFEKDVCDLMLAESAEAAFDRLHDAVTLSLRHEFGERARIIREPASAAAQLFEPDSIDFVFVDGDHRYEQVRQDLEAWWPKVARGGVLMGDDWAWPGVARAVEEFASSINRDVVLIGSPSNDHLLWLISSDHGESLAVRS